MKEDSNVATIHTADEYICTSLDNIRSDIRHLTQAVERFHGSNSLEHQRYDNRLAQVESVLTTLVAKLEVALKALRASDNS